MAKFVRLPCEVEAVQWDGAADTANRFIGERYGSDWEYIGYGPTIIIPTQSGSLLAEVGDWLVTSGGKKWVVEAEDFPRLYGPTD